MTIEVRFGNDILTLEKPKLKHWAILEEIAETVQEATDGNGKARCILQYLSVAFDKPVEFFEKSYWVMVLNLYQEVQYETSPKINFPFLRAYKEDEKKDGKVTTKLNYPGHFWYHLANFFANKYGWSLEYIASLEVDDAFGLMQEYELRDHLDKEFLWELSERSSGYDKATKQAKHIPFPKPTWLEQKIEIIKPVRVNKAHLPMGLVVDLNSEQNANIKPD